MRENSWPKICLGGTFNPIHHGHLICARAAAEAVGAKTVVILPAGNPWHKPGDAFLASGADRLEMCRRAVAQISGFEVDDREIRREGPTFTIDTVRELHAEGWKDVPWLIGADMLNFLPKWHEAEALAHDAHFIVMARPGTDFAWDTLPEKFVQLKTNIVEVPPIDISSTEIRRRVAAKLPIDFLCPPAVCRYIAEHGLYLAPSADIKTK